MYAISIQLAVALVVQTLSPAPSKMIAGIGLGEKPPYQECSVKMAKPGSNSGIAKIYLDDRAVKCWRRSFGNPNVGKPLSEIEYVEVVTDMPLPAGVGSNLKLTIVEGKVEAIELRTKGEPSQESVLVALTEKFGKPTFAGRQPVQNLTGTEFYRVSASWDFSDADLLFFGMAKVDEGWIRLRSSSLARRMEARKAEAKF